MVLGKHLQRRDVQGRRQPLQHRAFGRGRCPGHIAVARVEQDHAARAQIAVQPGIGGGRGHHLAGGHGPVEKREEQQFIGFQVDPHGCGGFDGGAFVQTLAEAKKPRLGHPVDLRVAGDHKGQTQVGGGHDRCGLGGGVHRGVGLDLLCHRTGGRHGQHQRHHRGGDAARQTARHEQRRQNVHQQQRKTGGQQRALQRLLGRGLQPLAHHIGGPVGGGQHRFDAKGVQRHAPVIPGIKAGRQGRRRSGFQRASQSLTLDPCGLIRVHQRAESIQRHLRHENLTLQIGSAGGQRARRHGQPLQHAHVQTRQGQGGPFRIGRHMEQHDLPLPQCLARDQGRAVGQSGDGAVGQIGIGLCQHLRGDLHLFRHRQAIEGRRGGKGGQRLGVTPAHRAAHGAPALAQAHRHQGVFLQPADVAGGQPGTGEAQQKAAFFHPVLQGLCLALADPRNIGQHDHIRRGQDHVRQGAVDQFRHRVQRLPQIVGGRQQLQPLGIALSGQKRDLAPFQAVVGQADSACRPHPRHLEPRDAVAQFGGKDQIGGALGRACGKGQRHPRQFTLDPRRVQAARRNLDLQRVGRGQAQGGHPDRAVLEGGRAQGQHRARAFEDRHRPPFPDGVQEGGAARMVHPVRQPVRLERALGQGLGPSCKIGGPGLRQKPRQPRRGSARRGKDHLTRRIGQSDHRDRPPLASRRLGHGHRPVDPTRPVAGVSPASVDQDQHRPGSRLAPVRVQHRSGKGQDRRRDGRHPQQEQPPRCPVGLGVVIAQTQEQRHARKPPPDRGRGHGAQDQPQQRQSHQPDQQQRCGKAQRSDHPHQWPRSSARYIHSRAACAGCPVWWHR